MLGSPGQPSLQRLAGRELQMLLWLISLSPSQDWQEIISLYEKDNTYLGKVTLKGPSIPGGARCCGSETVSLQGAWKEVGRGTGAA